MDFSEALAANEAALAHLDELKAECAANCDPHEARVMQIPTDARMRAAVAHHVNFHGDNAVMAAIQAGSLRMLSDAHVDAIRKVSEAVASGQDAASAAGADPAHVAFLEAAQQAHSAHSEALAEAYAEVGRTGRERAALEAS